MRVVQTLLLPPLDECVVQHYLRQPLRLRLRLAGVDSLILRCNNNIGGLEFIHLELSSKHVVTRLLRQTTLVGFCRFAFIDDEEGALLAGDTLPLQGPREGPIITVERAHHNEVFYHLGQGIVIVT